MMAILELRGERKRGVESVGDTRLTIYTLTYAAKKRVGGGSSGSSLSEEEREVIDLGRVESSMQAAVTALTREFNNTLVTRLTPGRTALLLLSPLLLLLLLLLLSLLLYTALVI